MHRITTRRSSVRLALVPAAAVLTLASAAPAAIVGAGGDTTIIAAPANTRPDVLESDTTIHVWEEVAGAASPFALSLDIDGTPGTYDAGTMPPLTGGLLPAGRIVDSHLIHMDPVGASTVTLSGWVRFDAPIVGVMLLCDQLEDSDAALGAPGTIYPTCDETSGWRGLDWTAGDETVVISPDRLRISFELVVSSWIDQIRVVTAGCDDRVTFDVPPGGSPWGCCGVGFVYEDVEFITRPFRFFDGTQTSGGFAAPTSTCCNDSPGLNLNNVNVSPVISDLVGTSGATSISFCYRDCGGNVNLRVNGIQAFAFNQLEDIPADFFAAAGVMLVNPPATVDGGCRTGTVTLVAQPGACIEEFGVGGQEFCIDDLCAVACGPVDDCPADFDDDGLVGTTDLLLLLGNWGACPAPCPPSCDGDLDGDCDVDASDLLAFLAAWGPC